MVSGKSFGPYYWSFFLVVRVYDKCLLLSCWSYIARWEVIYNASVEAEETFLSPRHRGSGIFTQIICMISNNTLLLWFKLLFIHKKSQIVYIYVHIKRRCGVIATRDQMTQKLTDKGHCTASNNEQSPYRIVSYKKHALLHKKSTCAYTRD